jgi:cytochrome c
MRHVRIALASGLAATAAAAVIAPATAQNAGGNAAAGQAVFARCAACHAVTAGTNRLGPSLFGIVGRKSGTAAGFAYSPAMKNAKITWTAGRLDAFLTRPSATVPGTKMTFAGIPSAADRANLIAYLATRR